MADVACLDASGPVPLLLERQRAEDVVYRATHLLHPPACPGPELRRHEIEDGDAACAGPAGEPPMKAGVVDEDDCIGPSVAEIAVGTEKEPDEDVGVEEDAQEPHHRQPAEWIKQVSAGFFHPFAAEADAFEVRPKSPQFADEIGAVQIAARFARGNEDTHRLPCLLESGQISRKPSAVARRIALARRFRPCGTPFGVATRTRIFSLCRVALAARWQLRPCDSLA